MDTRGSVTKYFSMRRMCMSYKLEIKQLLKFRHCRIYRSFIRELMRDKNLKTKGNSYLFFYVILCSYANFRISYIQIESNYFTVYPGHWVCRLGKMQEWFRLKNKKQIVAVLDCCVPAPDTATAYIYMRLQMGSEGNDSPRRELEGQYSLK